MELRCPECASYLANDAQIGKNQGKIGWVVILNLLTMVGETITGYLAGSMALVAEGWHMGSHVGALSITLLAYRLAKSPKLSHRFSFGAGKLIPLGGYTSAVILAIVALFVLIESVQRIFSPVSIAFNEAIGIACLGLIVNVIGATILHGGHQHAHSHLDHGDHHDEGHDHDDRHGAHFHDHNIRSAFLHILADAVTSLLAVFALLFGKLYHWNWLDPAIGIIGSVVIFSWAFQLCRDTGWELLDGHSKTINWSKLRAAVETEGTRILDFHVWRIAPTAVACELVVIAQKARGLEHYREILRRRFAVQHIVVEERLH